MGDDGDARFETTVDDGHPSETNVDDDHSSIGDHLRPLRDGLLGGGDHLQAALIQANLFGSAAAAIRIGRWSVLRKLGAGGMGEVVAAHDGDDQRVALKLLTKLEPMRLVRFKREFRGLAGIEHPNLVRLFELDVPSEGPAFFTMELVDGQPFVAWLRRGCPEGVVPEPERIRAALRQLASGVAHLHEAGLVHRDLKPSNVLVTEAGRVVILDFGLLADSSEPEARLTRDGQVVGTPAYMAPEQASRASSDAAVDAYALGVVLFESLTGRLPVSGSGLHMIVAKQATATPDPATVVAGIPDDLRRWCLALLEPDPARRASVLDLRNDLCGPTSSSAAAPSAHTRSNAVFVGRERELASLRAAARAVERTHAAITVHVRGTSGQGKTALLDAFCAQTRERGAVVLRGRCLERESVPFKGIDALIDALSAWLRHLDAGELTRYEPRHLDALARVFPVLADVWTAPRVALPKLPPPELRRLALSSLRELLARIADARELLVTIDDFQWADIDSARLIGGLVRAPDAPAMLLVIAFRDEVSQHEALIALLSRDEQAGREILELPVGPLPDADARELARTLLAKRDEFEPRERLIEACTTQAHGRPFFIVQMVFNRGQARDSDVDALVAARLAQLDREALEILQLIAIAAGPVSTSLVSELVGGERLPEFAVELRNLGLLAPSSSSEPESGHETLEFAHDRIRDSTVQSLGDDERVRLHELMANALERRGADPETIADHLEAARDPARALEFVERAAAHASYTLAFARAVDLYRRALRLRELVGGSIEHRRQLRAALAEQLVHIGKRAQAGELLRELADESDPRTALVLRTDAAEQFLHAGRVDEGIALTTLVLRALDEPVPRGVVWTILRFAWERLRLLVRGHDYVPHDETELDAELLGRVDLMIKLQIGLVVQSVGHANVMSARLLRRCLDLGERRRIGAMLMFEMTLMSALHQHARASVLEQQIRELANHTADVDLERLLDFGVCMSHFSQGSDREAHDHLARLVARLREQPTVLWVQALSMQLYVHLSVVLGHWHEIELVLPTVLAGARARANPYELVALETASARLFAFRGNVEAADERLRAAHAVLVPQLYTSVNLFLDVAEAFVFVLTGRLEPCLTLLEQIPIRARAAGMMLFSVHWRVLYSFEALCRVQLALRAPAERHHHRRIRALARRQQRSKYRDSQAHALLSLAALHSLRADVVATRRCWTTAEAIFSDLGHEAHAAALRWRLSRGRDDDVSKRWAEQAETYFARQRFADPAQIVALLVPAYSHGGPL